MNVVLLLMCTCTKLLIMLYGVPLLMCTCTKLLIMLYGEPLLMCTYTKLLIKLIVIVRLVVFKLFTFVITQKSSATIHLAKKEDNNRQTKTYSIDKEDEVGQPGEGEEKYDDDQHLYNPLPIVRHE